MKKQECHICYSKQPPFTQGECQTCHDALAVHREMTNYKASSAQPERTGPRVYTSQLDSPFHNRGGFNT